jgi:hypothetical protein
LAKRDAETGVLRDPAKVLKEVDFVKDFVEGPGVEEGLLSKAGVEFVKTSVDGEDAAGRGLYSTLLRFILAGFFAAAAKFSSLVISSYSSSTIRFAFLLHPQ